MKTCTTCGETKPESDFYREGSSPGRAPRLKSSCKVCHRARVSKQSKTPEGVAVRRARYRATGAAKQKAAMRELRERHFFVWRARLWSSRWKVRVTAVELAGLWMRQRGRCELSGRKLTRDAHLDHVVPSSAGGSHTVENLRWLDPRVNEARGAMTDDEFRRLCRDVLAGA